jgi:hypothetical protein
MVKQFADAPSSPLGDFARTLGGADADILARHACTLAHIARGVERVKCRKIARTFPNSLRRSSCALGGSFADISSAPADVATRAGWMSLSLTGRRRCAGRLRCACRLRGLLGLAVLSQGVLAPGSKCESEEHEEGCPQ